MIKKYGSFLGIILGVLSIFGAFLFDGGKLDALFLLAPIIVVFGGTFSAVIIGFGMNNFLKIFKLIKIAYSPLEFDIKGMSNGFLEIAKLARTNGLLSVEQNLSMLKYYFPQKLIRFVLDGTNSEDLESIAASEIKTLSDRHNSNSYIFTKMGGYAPTMGIIGTVMGLIQTLANAGNDPNILIHNIASAFIATLWGIFSANIIWLPIADKLKQWHMKEVNMMEVSLEAVLGIQSGDIPSVIKSRLISMLPQKEQDIDIEK